MVEDRIGYRYAKSIFDLAKEKSLLKEVKADMDIILDTCAASRDFRLFLSSPLIASLKKKSVIQQVFDGKFSSELTQMLLDILAQKGREQYLPNLAEAFQQLYNKENKILQGSLTSAVELPKTVVADIKKQVEKDFDSSLVLEEKTDPALIGGFILKVGDQLFDGSVASALRKLKRELSK